MPILRTLIREAKTLKLLDERLRVLEETSQRPESEEAALNRIHDVLWHLRTEELLERKLGRPKEPTLLLDDFRHFLQTRFPVLYTRVLEPTLADLREEHAAALAEGRPWKARRILLQGYAALAAAAVCQLGFSLLGRITALWKARSPK